ncbi:MAG: hypothetical protein N3D20_03240 [Candidatus Pacearchaeota archaeon]|nr:hypothetical protein [Candidatus Pacearchaeota archaeon]
MEQIYIQRPKEILKNLPLLEKKLNAKITIKGKNLTIQSSSLNEYEAFQVFKAINFGFPIKKSLLLLNEDYQFVTIKIKSYTKRRLTDIKARLIGKEGKTKRAIGNISGCDIIINEKENAVGILGLTENVDATITAITSLIKGAKESNIYAFLERMNRLRKKEFDLGLKQEKQTKKDNA